MTKNNGDFQFSKWINDSFLEVAKKAIKVVEKKQSTDTYSFYITFITADKNVVLPEDLLLQYPDMMTIVLENQFENLKVDRGGFYVTLSFQGVPSNLYIPWSSMVSFVEKTLDLHMLFNYIPNLKSKSIAKKSTTNMKVKNKANGKTKKSKATNVIDFASFKDLDS